MGRMKLMVAVNAGWDELALSQVRLANYWMEERVGWGKLLAFVA